MRLCRQEYESRTDSVRLNLTGRDGVLIHQYPGILLVLGIVSYSALSLTALNLGSMRPPSATRSRKAAGSRSRRGWNRCMIQTATRTTAGANKNKNATMNIYSANEIGCRILSILAHEAKPACVARATWSRASDERVPSVCVTSGRPAARLRIDFGCTRCTNAA
jgi:hypothetical protein